MITKSVEKLLIDVSGYLREIRNLNISNIYFKILLDSSGIYLASFEEGDVRESKESKEVKSEIAKMLKKDIINYFSGEKIYFDYPISERLNLSLTPFQQRVLEETKKIPYGETITYKELAERIGTKGYRAVGQALKRNPLPIIIPCHRVLGQNSLGGYAGKKNYLKRALLRLEGVNLNFEF